MSQTDLSHLWVWGCQCFIAIPLELHTKGGPWHFEGIFVGYEENCVGWCVRDLNRKYHFSCNVIFNKLVPGYLSPSKSPTSSSPLPTPSSSSSPPPCPPCTLTCTTKGQAFADSIHLQDECLAAQYMKTLHTQQSSSASTDFVSLFATDDILPPDSLVDLSSHEDNAFSSFCLLTAVDHHHFQRPQNFDLWKSSESYYEALAWLDADVWHSAMCCELDSLEECKAFEWTILPLDQKALGNLWWCYAYKFNPDGSIIKGKEKACLVAQGFSQWPEDYSSTYSPVVEITSIHFCSSSWLENHEFWC